VQHRRFKNAHLSYSRLSRFEQCPLSFKLSYIDKKQRAAPSLPLRFGKAVHAVLERLVKEHISEEREGPLSEERAVELWRQASIENELMSLKVFGEGLEILRAFILRQGSLEHRDLLAVEARFELMIGPFKVLGFIDRVDRVDAETIEIIDYKTNRMLFSRDEVDHSLQMSIYHLAAQQLWPWAKRVRLTFDMLRHGIRMTTERTPEQLDATKRYVEALGSMTEEATHFPPRLNTNCVWCDHRADCPAYADALKNKRGMICEDLDDLLKVAREREELALVTKILTARKRELEERLKLRLKEQDLLLLGNMRYKMITASTKRYPPIPTLRALSSALGMSVREVIPHVVTINKKALDELVRDGNRSLGKQKILMLKAELEAIAEHTHSHRFSAKEVK